MHIPVPKGLGGKSNEESHIESDECKTELSRSKATILCEYDREGLRCKVDYS